MKRIMRICLTVVWLLGCAAVGQASGTVACPYDGSDGSRTNDCETIGGKEYDIYRCSKGHTYSILRVQQASSVSDRGDFATGQVSAISSMKPDADFGGQKDYVNDGYDFSKAKVILVGSFSNEERKSKADEKAVAIAREIFAVMLNLQLKEDCPMVVKYDDSLAAMLHDKYVEYAAAGGLLAERDFYNVTLVKAVDLLVTIKVNASGHDPEYVWSDVTVTAADIKTEQTIFTRRDQRIQPRVSSEKVSEAQLTYDIIVEYTLKLADLLRRSRQAQSE